MCIVDIEVDEKELQCMRPELNTTAAIQLWIQQMVDLQMQQMRMEEDETMSIEEACELTLAAVREEYAKP